MSFMYLVMSSAVYGDRSRGQSLEMKVWALGQDPLEQIDELRYDAVSTAVRDCEVIMSVGRVEDELI
jgi:hypothetical protein